MIKLLKINFKDRRGKIIDIFVKQPKEHCSLVTFNKFSVRGNHFHKKTTQYSYIMNGSFIMITAKVNKQGKIIGPIKKSFLNSGHLVTHKPFYAHAFKALEKSSLLAFANGARGGNKYEEDTFRLKEKLI
jgi:dTDP-4-dehydrorhamnose 3,5-epimerase